WKAFILLLKVLPLESGDLLELLWDIVNHSISDLLLLEMKIVFLIRSALS
ncbi:hypothetical protein S245_009054, partial [Arachis hypogaea]